MGLPAEEVQHHGVKAGGIFHMQPMAGIGDGLDLRFGEVILNDSMMMGLDVR